ncbi:TusA-related sulfurtransferase [Paenibacillus algorifonticola]|uniref:TusA-related sulfurtransferase n=1 Tax=Paenibacillus algorifonticola TaxID=684063 RepID=A0A1I2C4F4_9BACL|nr:DUF2249 domain-containing protein [Paenibacillus algorifonticola]SFE63271.1 TusA-related sulfurtransferase [Paenibacillus algorifonticola]
MLPKQTRIVELDVRPYLRQKLEPFQLIMDQVKELEIHDVLVLHATFKPTPLLGLMKVKGYANKVQQVGPEHWSVTFVNKKNKSFLQAWDAEPDAAMEEAVKEEPTKTKAAADELSAETHPAAALNSSEHSGTKIIRLDNRGLEPPQPMIRTLNALEKLNAGDEVVIHNDRVPVFLIEELNSLGYAFTIEEQEDGSAQVFIQKS